MEKIILLIERIESLEKERKLRGLLNVEEEV
jgi:hypothetical protein